MVKFLTRNDREAFYVRKCIYIPVSSDKCAWAFPTECVWGAAQKLQSKFALELLYESGVLTDASSLPDFGRFFTNVIGIDNCSWAVYVEELKALKASDCEDMDIIGGIYAALDTLRPTIIGISKDKLK